MAATELWSSALNLDWFKISISTFLGHYTFKIQSKHDTQDHLPCWRPCDAMYDISPSQNNNKWPDLGWLAIQKLPPWQSSFIYTHTYD